MTAPAELATRVAVIGMAVRVPEVGDLAGFWSALAAGRETLTRSARDGATVAHGVVPDGDLFDAEFFGYAPYEALLMDPQHRVFLECAWEALEHAGYDPRAGDRVVGVYAGCGDTGHLERARVHRDQFPEVSDLQLHLASSVDFLTARIAYKLGLTGPAVTVQTACATGLVAVHAATQALLAGECDMALAGGITLHVPFPYDQPGEEGIVAPDGHNRSFDADARGTVVSDGAGIVVLKRLDDALTDGDHVHAVILGSAVTNDGAGKVGFTAPSVDGVAKAAQAALALAGVDPATVDYVEGHGTGTPAGDPIELRGLAKAFGPAGSSLLGSVKSNIGHTDVAAGVLGLIKVVLSLRHELIPATLHFRAPNPAGDLDASPFRVSATSQAWPQAEQPRRAGVSSLGLGGTNAHVILEESPPDPRETPTEAHHLVPLSARSPRALAAAVARLADHLRSTPDVPIGDIAWTLQLGRHAHAYRSFAVVAGAGDAVRALTGVDPGRLAMPARPTPDRSREVVFLFPGHGGQHVGMAEELYRSHPAFGADLDACAELAAPRLGLDLRAVLFPDQQDAAAVEVARQRLATMVVGQVAVFAVEYALARLWQSWGVQPKAVTGHSVGAYAAAITAGVLDLPDAVTLVLERGRLMDEMPAGAMLAVSAPVARLAARLGPRLSVAAINGPAQCVLSGPVDAIAAIREELVADEIEVRLLHISTAAHSWMVEPTLATFEKAVASVRLSPPRIAWISDSTGELVTPDMATDPGYWIAHMRRTVDFSAVLRTVLTDNAALVEVGPGRTLSGLARQHPVYTGDRTVVASMPHVADPTPGPAVLLAAAGSLWQAGVPIDWAAMHPAGRYRRVPLPTYPFERRRFVLGQPIGPVVDSSSAAVDDAPPTATEAIVAAAYRAILGIDPVDRHRSFFELGGDSLLAARVAAILRRELDESIVARAIFRAPTVASLAAAIDEQREGRDPTRGSRWLLCRRRRADAASRLYCFPHSGGSVGEFMIWSDALPEAEIWGVQAPGHGARTDEEPLTSMDALITAVADEVDLVPPYDLFGHSLGAAVAYELAVALRVRGRPLPRSLYLSAHEAPHVHRPDPSLPLRTDDSLLDEVEQQFGAVPADLRDDPDWRALVLGTLRADLRIVADYRPTAAEPLPCSIVAMGGTEDQVATREGLAAWAAYTTGEFRLHMFAGGHFYFRENQHDVLRHLAADLARTAQRAVPGQPALGLPAAIPGTGRGGGAPR